MALAIAALPGAARAEMSGPPSAIDGDTLDIAGQRIRLFGIDAPESEQMCVAETRWRCGAAATRALAKKIAGRTVVCTERDREAVGLVLAVCRIGNEDLARWLVSQGWALAYRSRSTEYVGEEQVARATHRGVWRGSILAPWDWRVAEQAQARANRRTRSEQLVAAEIPGRKSEAGPRRFTVRAGQNGHFQVEARANGQRIPLIVDTGATVVTLTRADAKQIGLDVNGLDYNRRVRTANGVARVAPVRLREMSVGPIVLTDVDAVVIQGASSASLLGMSFLGRLESYSVSGETLTMTMP